MLTETAANEALANLNARLYSDDVPAWYISAEGEHPYWIETHITDQGSLDLIWCDSLEQVMAWAKCAKRVRALNNAAFGEGDDWLLNGLKGKIHGVKHIPNGFEVVEL